MKKLLIVTLALTFLLSACGKAMPVSSKNGIEISAPFAHAAASGENTAAFMSIKNNSAEADTLLKASSDVATMMQVMETKMEGDVMSMGEVPGIDIPAGGTVELKSGGYHIMLMSLKQDLKDGTTITITLEFAKAGKIVLEVPVKTIAPMQ